MRKLLLEKTSKVLFLVLAMLLAASINLLAQQSRTVTGRITDSDGEALPGANVTVKGTAIGVVTNLEGYYSIDVEQGLVLEFSFIGYIKQEVTIGNQTEINVTLELSLTKLDEIVVIGYGFSRKVDITGSVTTVDVETFASQKPLTVEQALQGKVAGLRIISSDGAPGADFDMEIRGMSSINASSGPLVIIDGLPGGDLKNIDPGDIASISILKDASSTAIYGTQGANGVVLISTKRGAVGKTTLDVKALYGMQSLPRDLDFQDPESFMNTKLAKMYMQTSTDYNTNDDPDQNYSYYRAWNEKWYEDPERITDWQALIFQPGKRQEYNITLTSGNEKVRNATSFGWQANDGIVLTTGYKRATLRSNTDFIVSDKLTVRNNISLAYRRKVGEQNFNNDGVFVKAGQFSPMIDKFMDFGAIRQWEHSGSGTIVDNPYLELTQRDRTEDNFNLMGNLELDYKIVKGLSFIASAGGSYGNYNGENFATTLLRSSWSQGGSMSISRNTNYSYRLLSQFLYQLEVGSHSINATVGFEAQESGNDNFGQSYENFGQVLGPYGINDLEYTLKSPKPNYSFNKRNLASLISRLQYNYLDRYLFSATLRSDGSSKFGPENAWGIFPAFGLGWRISEESFMQNIDWLSNLKFRGSWGKAGNDNIDSYLSLAMYGPNNRYAVFGQDRDQIIVPYHPSQIPNFDIGWETTIETNLGIDIGVLNNRIFASFDWYNRNTIDMLLDVALPAIAGVERQTQNKGSLNNRGWEFQADGVVVRKSKFQWQLGVNLYSNLTTVTELQDEKVRDFQDVNTLIQIGHPLGEKYGYIVAGVVNTQEFNRNAMRQNSGGSGSSWGSPVFADITGDGMIDTDDQTVIFNPQALINGGITTKIAYGQFDLFMLFRASYGADIYNQNLGELGRTGNLSRALLQKLGEEMWLPNNQDGTYVGSNSDFSDGFTSFLIEDGSFLKCSSIDLSFRFPQEWIRSMNLAGVSLSYSLDNVATLSRYSWFDPDVNSGGNFRYYGTDRSAYPYSRTHMFTLRLTL